MKLDGKLKFLVNREHISLRYIADIWSLGDNKSQATDASYPGKSILFIFGINLNFNTWTAINNCMQAKMSILLLEGSARSTCQRQNFIIVNFPTFCLQFLWMCFSWCYFTASWMTPRNIVWHIKGKSHQLWVSDVREFPVEWCCQGSKTYEDNCIDCFGNIDIYTLLF